MDMDQWLPTTTSPFTYKKMGEQGEISAQK